MELNYGLYSSFLLVAVVMQAAIAIDVWRRRPAPGVTPFMVQVLGIGIWCLAYALELRATTDPAKIFWAKARYLGIVPVPLAWLAFASQYTRSAAWLGPRSVALLSIVPLATVALAWTNDAHHLLWLDLTPETIGGTRVLRRTAGSWYWVWVVYAYSLMSLATLLIIRALVRIRRPYRVQNVALLVGSLVPFLCNALYMSGRGSFAGLDLTPLSFGLSALVFAWGLFRAHLLDLVPVAREAVVEGMRDGVLVLDWRGRIVDLNPAAGRIIGSPARAAIGLPLEQVLPDARAVSRLDGFTSDEGMEIAAGEGEAGRWYELRASPLRDEHQRVIGRLVVLHDVTERRASERSLAEARDQALQAARAKSEFLATISHEIRTPMNAIIGMTDILLDTSLPDEQREYGERVRAAAVHLLTILNDILDFSKIEAGKLEIEVRDFDVAAEVEETVDLLAEKAQEKGLELVCRIDPSVPSRVAGDAVRLRQILINLLANAVKFTEQGEIVVRVALGEKRGEHSIVKFEVRDTGIGIPAEAQGRLFESFSQVEGASTSRYGGTGLGLAIVKRLTLLMGGEVGLESRPAGGSNFWLTLPLIVRPAPPVSPPSLQLGEAPRVLVVDDNEASLAQLEECLQSAGISAETARDGEDALARLRAAARRGVPYQLGLIDLHMPGMGGLELVRRVQADPLVAATPLVLLTPPSVRRAGGAASRGADGAASKGAGGAPWSRGLDDDLQRRVVGSLRKPVHRAELLARVMTAFAREGGASLLQSR